jgi:hypothetical protein
MAAVEQFRWKSGVAIALVCVILIASGLFWRQILAEQFPGETNVFPTPHHPLIEFLKLVAALLVGLVITAAHRATSAHALSTSMQQAQILLCVSGALMMVIIGDSLARAFGIAGAASIIRFRTPVDDPRDTIILFLSLGLGMACGLGAFALAGLSTGFLSLVLWFLARATTQEKRTLIAALSAAGPQFPTAAVQEVFEKNSIVFETRAVMEGEPATARFRIEVAPTMSLDVLSQELRFAPGSTVQSVAWEKAGKKD